MKQCAHLSAGKVVALGRFFARNFWKKKKNLPDEIKFGINVSERKVQKYSNLILHIKNDWYEVTLLKVTRTSTNLICFMMHTQCVQLSDSWALISEALEMKTRLPPSAWWRNDNIKYLWLQHNWKVNDNVAYLKCRSGHEEFWSWCSLQLSQMLVQRNLKIKEKTIISEENGAIFAIYNTKYKLQLQLSINRRLINQLFQRSIHCFQHFSSKKHQPFSGVNFSNVKTLYFSRSYIIVNWISVLDYWSDQTSSPMTSP